MFSGVINTIKTEILSRLIFSRLIHVKQKASYYSLKITSKMDTELQPGICEKCKKQTVVQLRQSDELLCHDCYKEHKKQAESSEKEKDASPLGENKMADDEDETSG